MRCVWIIPCSKRLRPRWATLPVAQGQISQALGAGAFVTSSFVREPTSYASQILSVWMQNLEYPNTLGTLNDTWPASEPNGGNLEVLTPDSFTSRARCDPIYTRSGR